MHAPLAATDGAKSPLERALLASPVASARGGLYISFNEREIAGTIDFSDDTLLDVDQEGNVVALTLEHASANVDLAELSFQQVAAAVPQP